MLHCVAVCCSVLQCVAVCQLSSETAVENVYLLHIPKCVVVCVKSVAVRCSVLQRVAVCCSVLRCAGVCCSVQVEQRDGCLACLPFAYSQVCCSVLQCDVVCCSALQCVAIRCSVLQCVAACKLSSETAVENVTFCIFSSVL